MAPGPAAFHFRFKLLTLVLPAVAAAAAVFIAGWFTFHPPESERRATIEIVAGSALLLLCAGSFDFFSRWGFSLLGLQRLRARPDPAIRQRLSALLDHEPELRLNNRPSLIEAGELPLVMVAWQSADLVWISTAALERFNDDLLWLITGTELLREKNEGMLDRILFSGGFWWAVVLAVMLLIDSMAVGIALFCLAAFVFVVALNYRSAVAAGRADRQAVLRFGSHEYATSLAAYVRASMPGLPGPALARRLQKMGLPATEAETIAGRESGS